MPKSLWAEIKNDYTDETNENGILKATYIDAWKTSDDNEEGKVIAKVILTEGYEIIVDYIDNCVRCDELAEEKIQEAIERLKQDIPRAERFGIFFEGNQYVYRKINKIDIKNFSMIAVAFDEESAKFITDSYNDDMAING